MSSEIICSDERQRRLLRVLFRKSGVTQRRTVIPWQTAYQWNESADFSDSGSHQTVETMPVCKGPGTGERMLLYETHAPPLAIEACRGALQQPLLCNDSIDSDVFRLSGEPAGESAGRHASNLDASSITHLVTVSCTGFAAPGLDWKLFDALGLSGHVQRVHVGFMGCHGAINGLRTARGLVAADPDAVVLVCAVELCSLHYRMDWDDEAMVGNALFADGAAALIVVGEGHDESGLRLVDTASVRIPDSGDQMSWRIGDHGFDMSLTGRVPGSIQQHLRSWLVPWLDSHSLSIDDIADWIVHPGGPKILDATETALGLGENSLAHSRQTLSQLGNMSSPTVMFVLGKSIKSQNAGPRVMLAFGPGLVAEAALLDEN